MGDRKTLAMARKELEDMYVGVPDESVNLSFQDFAEVVHNKKKLSPSSTMAPISESAPSPPALAKLPSLDFNRALQQIHHTTPHHHYIDVPGHQQGAIDQRSFMSDDMSHVSGMTSMAHSRGRRRQRPGIPHSNICAVCSTYTYIFRHRCLVCGRVYCRQCVAIGMGEMTEGRKCKDCLGRRFSQSYIKKAGNVGCCFGYPSTVKQQELKWAEKGPRTATETVNGHRSMVAPRSISPRPPSTPTNPPSFIANSTYTNNNQFLPC